MIHDLLKLTPGFSDSIEILYQNKPKNKILKKACEEISELLTAILQKMNKKETPDEEILEEMVDAQTHIILLQKFFSQETIRKMVDQKVEKFLLSKDLKKYSTIKV